MAAQENARRPSAILSTQRLSRGRAGLRAGQFARHQSEAFWVDGPESGHNACRKTSARCHRSASGLGSKFFRAGEEERVEETYAVYIAQVTSCARSWSELR